MIKILFVCHGNICRSPMSEFILKSLITARAITSDFYIGSAATSSEEIYGGIGNPVYPPARQELSRHGISCEGKTARQVTKADYDRFDYLIVMEEYNIRNLMRIIGSDPEQKVHRLLDYTNHPADIDDPWYTGKFDLTYNEIVTGCEAFLTYLGY